MAGALSISGSLSELTVLFDTLQVMYQTGLTSGTASLIVTAIILPLSQIQHMHDVGWVSIFGTLGMLLAGEEATQYTT